MNVSWDIARILIVCWCLSPNVKKNDMKENMHRKENEIARFLIKTHFGRCAFAIGFLWEIYIVVFGSVSVYYYRLWNVYIDMISFWSVSQKTSK